MQLVLLFDANESWFLRNYYFESYDFWVNQVELFSKISNYFLKGFPALTETRNCIANYLGQAIMSVALTN